MKKFFRPLIALAIIGVCAWGNAAKAAPLVEDAPYVPENIFEWVQSTSRADYYFNKEQICYRVDKEGYIDLNTLMVPTLKTYDEVQKQDVRTKREWKSLPLAEYDRLTGAAEYLRFDLNANTVTIYAREDLDETWTALERTEEPTTHNLKDFSARDVDGIFYRTILDYAYDHQDDLLAHSLKRGKLREADQKRLEKEKKEKEKAAKKKAKKQSEKKSE